MDELRKNHILHIELKDGSRIEGKVIDYQKDRVMVLIDDNSVENAKKLQELDDTKVTVQTHFGIKRMFSSVISPLNHKNCIIIENNPSQAVNQKRQYVRVVDDFKFNVELNNEFYPSKCANISAGGIAFTSIVNHFEIGTIVKVIFPVNVFSKLITCEAEIIKSRDDFFIAQFKNLNVYDENKIVKRIFELLARK